MEQQRRKWSSMDRRRKEPSLYDEYLNQEKQSTAPPPPPSPQVPQVPSALPLSRDASATTIRTVTPDTNALAKDKEAADKSTTATTATPATTTHAFDTYFQPFHNNPPTSPSGSVRQKEKATTSSPRDLVVGWGTNNLGRSESTDARRIVGSRRPRTKTLDEKKTRDKSPASLLSKHRIRHGSIHTAPSMPTHSASESVSSTGHAQIASPLSQSSFSSNSTAPPHRPISPVSTLASIASNNTDSMSGPLPNANAKRILHLMKTLCGRMSGSLHFRRGPTSPWQTAHCYIQDDVGSLMCEPDEDAALHRTLVPDLRGCNVRTAMDEDTQIPYLDISSPTCPNLELHIRLQDRSDFDSWFAALLCWHPIRPKGLNNKMTQPQSPIVTGQQSIPQPLSPLSESRRNSEMSMSVKEAPVIKVGPMIYWDYNISYNHNTVPRTLTRPVAARMQSYGSHWWRRVSCTLRENGEMKLYAESGSNLLSVVQLSQLSRCAVQRLDPSVLDNDFCIAIYPQYTSGSAVPAPLRPIYLSLETRILYEVWLVLLRAFTIPQLYGPKPTLPDDYEGTSLPQTLDTLLANSSTDMFRMERSLSIRVVEARLPAPLMSPRAEINHQHAVRQGQWPPSPQHQDGHYVEILLDGESRGKTQVKHEGTSPFWREEFEYLDLPAVLTSASVLLRRRPPDLTTPREQHELRLVHEAYGLVDDGPNAGRAAGFSAISHDVTIGKVEIYLEELEGAKEVEKWWPVINGHGESAGEILIKARAEENVILMSRDYEPLSQLLHKFDNELTLQIAQMIPTELRRLSDTMLNIYQVSGKVGDWICSLVEEEIDGIHKETPASRLRYSRRVGGGEENAAAITASSERELLVRDMNKNATLEANLLFRGNTLLTKSLDSYMRRVGKEYLLAALGPTIREINEKDPDCEVDPNKVNNERGLERNWHRLLQATQDVWNAIKNSVKNAPVELKLIFRHIRACAEDRYGDFLRSVSFSSVSGFLFLRFFCPAVLNPKLFSLLKDDPKPRARRTFTLIAKSLQGLANMASFGSKEHWMEPMNAFLSTHRESFKTFIDDVCTLPVEFDTGKTPSVPASYSTPLAIRNRLPLTSREGFPSLPYLIDQAREFAGLVELWLTGTSGKDGNEGISAAIGKEDGELLTFHTICTQLNARTRECLARAERAERPNSSLSFRWEELIEQLQSSSGLGLVSRPQSKSEGMPGESGDDPDLPIGMRMETDEGPDMETPTRDSFDDVAMRAAGEAAARARGAFASYDFDGDEPILIEEDGTYSYGRNSVAASAAATTLQQGHSTMSLDRRAGIHFRGSFDMQRHGNTLSGTTTTSITGGSTSLPPTQQGLQSSTSVMSFPLPRNDRAERDRELAREIESQLTGGRRGNLRGGSAHGSHHSGSNLSSETDSNATTALPSLQKERERREREKERLKKKEKEERERRMKDLVPIASLVGGFRDRMKEKKAKEKEKESNRDGHD